MDKGAKTMTATTIKRIVEIAAPIAIQLTIAVIDIVISESKGRKR